GLADYLRGEGDGGPNDAAAKRYLDDWTDVLLKKQKDADGTDLPLDYLKKAGMGLADTKTRDQLVAGFMATRDPAIWNLLKDRMQETWVQQQTRDYQEKQGYAPPQLSEDASMMDKFGAEVASYQQSPIDMALTLFPYLQGAKILKATGAAAKLKHAAKGVA